MLRMSKLTDYGTAVMTYLARESGRLHTANEIAAGVHVAPPTASKILKALVRKGLVASHRGIKGGYVLARAAEDISVVQVIDAIEGPVGLTQCSNSPGACVQEPHCSVRGSWQQINRTIREALAGVTLAEMAKPVPTQVVRFNKLPPAPRARA